MKIPLLLLVLISGLLSQYSFAWEFHEHTKAGKLSYILACMQLGEEVGAKQARILQKYLCPSHKTVVNGKEKRVYPLSDTYGRMSAISGDHIENPEDFFSVESEIGTGSAIQYATLASHNAAHFWPVVKTMWEKNHFKALNFAREAKQLIEDSQADSSHLNAIAIKSKIDLALAYNAFADHFLQDAFAIGHSGFGRAGTSADLSVGFHDKFNKYGALLANKKNGSWMAYGDGRFSRDKNKKNKNYLIQENTHSILNVFFEVLGMNKRQSVDFPTHTSNRFRQPLVKFHKNEVTCDAFFSESGELVGLDKETYSKDLLSLDRTPSDCLMPIDALGAMPVRRVMSFDIGLNSTRSQNKHEIFGGYDLAVSLDSLFNWKLAEIGMMASYKDVNDKGKLTSLGGAITSPYRYGDLGVIKYNLGYSNYDLKHRSDKEGAIFGVKYLIPIRIIKNASFYLGGEYLCTGKSALRCNSDVSELSLKVGLSITLKTVGGGYNKHTLMD